KDVIKRSEAAQKENEKIITKQEEELKKIKTGSDNKLFSSTALPPWAIGAAAALLLIVLFLFYKNLRLSSDDRKKRQMLERYADDLANLKTNENKKSQAMNAEIDSLKNRLRATVKEDGGLQNPPIQTTTPASSVQFIPYIT